MSESVYILYASQVNISDLYCNWLLHIPIIIYNTAYIINLLRHILHLPLMIID